MKYTQKVIDHFRNPRNQGKINNADAVSEKGNPACGDVMRIYLKIGENDDKKIIEDIKFETFGCAAAIAVTSILTEMVKGRTLEEALQLNKDEIVKELGGLPAQKIHCSMLGVDTLHEAIKQYQNKN